MAAYEAPGLHVGPELAPADLRRVAELADASGYSVLWYGDVRFVRDCYVALAVAAEHSKRLLLGPGVSVAQNRHPVQIAAAIATIDELSEGRAVLGLGSGSGRHPLPALTATGGIATLEEVNREKSLAASGAPASRSAEAYVVERPVRGLREAIELIRMVLAGEPVHYAGEVFGQDGGQLSFRTSHPIPIYVACHGPQVIRLSGKIADGVLLANMARRHAVETAVRILREGEAAAGRPSGSVAVHNRLETLITDNEEAGMAETRRRIAGRVINSWPNWNPLTELGLVKTERLEKAASAGDYSAVTDALTEADVRSMALVGSPERVVDQLQEVLAGDVTTVTMRPMGVDAAGRMRTIIDFIEKVWPKVGSGVPR